MHKNCDHAYQDIMNYIMMWTVHVKLYKVQSMNPIFIL